MNDVQKQKIINLLWSIKNSLIDDEAYNEVDTVIDMIQHEQTDEDNKKGISPRSP